jgi:pyridoxine 5-phosphate synthase
MIEIHTGAFCDATTKAQRQKEFSRIVDAAKIGTKLKLEVNAGHGICYNSIKAFKGFSEINEFSIGHSIVSRSILTGMEQAVRDMKKLISAL